MLNVYEITYIQHESKENKLFSKCNPSLQNLMAENEYSKTHIRLQKTRPREEKKPVSESTVTQSSTSTTELQNIQEANRYSKTQISKLKIKKYI